MEPKIQQKQIIFKYPIIQLGSFFIFVFSGYTLPYLYTHQQHIPFECLLNIPFTSVFYSVSNKGMLFSFFKGYADFCLHTLQNKFSLSVAVCRVIQLIYLAVL